MQDACASDLVRVGASFETTQTNHPQFRKSKHLKTARGFCLQNLVPIPSVYSDSLRILKQPKHPTAYWHCVDRTVHLLVPLFFFFFKSRDQFCCCENGGNASWEARAGCTSDIFFRERLVLRSESALSFQD